MAKPKETLLGRLAPCLPYARRFARALLKDQALGDAAVRSALEQLTGGKETLIRGIDPRVSIYKIIVSLLSKESKSTPIDLNRLAHILVALEGLTLEDSSLILNRSPEEIKHLLSEAQNDIEIASPKKVLIIEDEAIIADDIASFVVELGHSVTAITSTHHEAVSSYLKNPTDLLLVDIQLRDGSSGVGAAFDIQKINPNVAIIFVTAFPERLLTGDRPEPTFLITKPFQPETLKAAISQALFLRAERGEMEGPQSVENSDDGAWKTNLLNIEQDPLGARFGAAAEALFIKQEGDVSDSVVAQNADFSQLHEQVRSRSATLQQVKDQVNRQHGWDGFSDTIDRFSNLVELPSEELSAHIATLWSEAVELGSFLELDAKVRRERSSTNMTPLDPEAQRKLASLVRVAAPWIRMFPTARRLDDETGSFLTKDDLFETASTVINFAGSSALIRTDDRAILVGLLDAAKRGEFQGEKARARSVFSAKNLVIGTLLAAYGLYGPAIQSQFADRSILAERAGAFLADTMHPLEELFVNSTPDLRAALESAREDFIDFIVSSDSNYPSLQEANHEDGTWLADVSVVVNSLKYDEFTLSEIYAHESRLAALHPKNNNVRAKIRQQLQLLRDHGTISFLGNGVYRRLL